MGKTGELDSLRITVLAEDSVLYESPYLGQHGVSFFLEGTEGSNTRRILVDVGQNSQALLNNMRLMHISPSTIDAIVLTHCHYDHTQGVVSMLKEIGKSDIPVIVKTIENGKIKDDSMLDDISVIANVKGKGLVIVTGCSHAGIVNIARHAIELTSCEKIEAIIGGLHLVEAPDGRIKRTGEALSKLNPAWICAGHCTGFKAQVELYLVFAERFSPLHTGMQFEI